MTGQSFASVHVALLLLCVQTVCVASLKPYGTCNNEESRGEAVEKVLATVKRGMY